MGAAGAGKSGGEMSLAIPISGYILVNIKSKAVAHYTFSRNRRDAWSAATTGLFSKKDLLAQGWKCVYVWAEGRL